MVVPIACALSSDDPSRRLTASGLDYHFDRVFTTIVDERDERVALRDAVNRHTCLAIGGLCLHDVDKVHRLAVAVMNPEGLPIRGKTRRHAQLVYFELEAQQRFDDQPVEPAGGARVPGPAAAAGMRRNRIDVS